MQRRNFIGWCGATLLLAGCNEATTGTASALVGGLPFLGGKASSASGNLEQDAQRFNKYLRVATVNLLHAVGYICEATSRADYAKLAQAQADQIEKGGTDLDLQKWREASKVIEEASISRAEIARVTSKAGQALLLRSAVHLGVGTLVDKRAIDLARHVATTPPTSLTSLTQKGVQAAFEGAQLAVRVLPRHVEVAGTWSLYLSEYFTSHQISPPSLEQQRKVASEDLTPEEIKDVFGSLLPSS